MMVHDIHLSCGMSWFKTNGKKWLFQADSQCRTNRNEIHVYIVYTHIKARTCYSQQWDIHTLNVKLRKSSFITIFIVTCYTWMNVFGRMDSCWDGYLADWLFYFSCCSNRRSVSLSLPFIHLTFTCTNYIWCKKKNVLILWWMYISAPMAASKKKYSWKKNHILPRVLMSNKLKPIRISYTCRNFVRVLDVLFSLALLFYYYLSPFPTSIYNSICSLLSHSMALCACILLSSEVKLITEIWWCVQNNGYIKYAQPMYVKADSC